jgi:hypothetical protein
MAKTARSARGSSVTGKLLAVVAVAGMAALLGWLAATSEPSTVAPVMDATNDTAMAGAERVAAADFESAMQSYWGREIELVGVKVEQVMTPELIWVSLPSGQAFLVKLSAEAMSASAPATQSTVAVTGRVLAKTDSVLNAWQQSGVIRNAGQRQQSEFGSTYIEARRVVPAGSSGG